MTRWQTNLARGGVAAPLTLLALIYVAFVLPHASDYALRVLSVAGIYALLALGYGFIFGQAGALSLAQGTFMGLGAYVSGILAVRYGIAFDAALPASVGLPVLLALLVAIPVLRLQTHYFALATLLIGQIVLLLVTQWESVTGGANGIGGVPPLSLLGHAIEGRLAQTLLVWSLVAAGALAAWLLVRGRQGDAFAIARVHPAAARSVGIDTGLLRLAAFLLSAAYAGLAGSLYVHAVGVLSPDVLGFPVMITCLTIAVVGSRLRVAGAIAGGRVETAERLLARLWTPPPEPLPAPAEISLTQPRGATLLEIDGLTRGFGGVRALSDVALDLRAGEVLGLIGPNGSGKTTLLNVVTGIYRPDAGRVRLAGADIAVRAPHVIARLGIARSFQTPALVPTLTALDNVAVARGADRAMAMALLDRLGAVAHATDPAGSLPPGIARRVEIARALATSPRLLLLDEPAAGLNETEQADLALRLRRIADDGIGLLVIEHNMPFLAPLADRMVCLDQGRVIAAGTPAQVQSDKRVIEAYLGTPA
jgi:branched-chain amino acid transport system permease protein